MVGLHDGFDLRLGFCWFRNANNTTTFATNAAIWNELHDPNFTLAAQKP
jgi:hypothetical protein